MMASTAIFVTELILKELTASEKRLLVLTVAVRKGLGSRDNVVPGDLSQRIRLALRKLVASKTVVETDGVFALSHEFRGRKRPPSIQAAVPQ